MVVGIDLGTTYSCAGVWSSDKAGVRIVTLDEDQRTIPSCVAIDALSGDVTATGRVAERLPGLVRNVKRDIGSPQQGAYAETMSMHILRSIKERIQREMHADVHHAVVTVPAYFTNEQRASTKRAAERAGWVVMKILNEPTAAALAYGYRNSEVDKNILIYDWGGGTFDVTILTMDHNVFEVRSTAGNTHLGGEDLTIAVAGQLREKYASSILGYNDEDVRRCCEQAKRSLSSQTNVTLAGCCTLTRFAFDTLCDSYFGETIDLVNRALRDADMAAADIHEVVLVGGSTRIPHVVNLLRGRFPASVINNSLHPDESVAYGATIQAALLSGYENSPQHIMLMDVIPLTLGVRTAGGVMTPVLERNTSIPVKAIKKFSTHMDNQTCISISIYEGEMPLVKDCLLLGDCVLEGLPARPRGALVVAVTFAVDANGILHVSAIEEACGATCTITLNSGVTTLNDIDRQCALKQAIGQRDTDRLDTVRLRLALATHIRELRATLPALRKDENIPNAHVHDLEEYMVHVDRVLTNSPDSVNADVIREYDRVMNQLTQKLHLPTTQLQHAPTVA
jgi:L1 cell adhesion molecule like protein